MTATVLSESQRLVLELFAFLQSLDRFFEHNLVQAREQLQHWQQRTDDLLRRWQGNDATLRLKQKLDSLALAIDQHAPSKGEPARSMRDEWNAFRQRIQQPYEAVVAALRQLRHPVPSLRPRNIRRTSFHVLSGVVCLILVQHLLSPKVMVILPGVAAALAWTLELFRRRSAMLNTQLMRLFKPIAHPHESHRVNSATWYTTALFILGAFFSPLATSLALIVLAIGDPAASEIGRRFGKIRITRRRTLEGGLAFAFTGGLAAFLVMTIYYSGLSTGATLLLAAAAAIPGAITELYSHRIDDNLSVPVAVAAGVTVMGWMLGA